MSRWHLLWGHELSAVGSCILQKPEELTGAGFLQSTAVISGALVEPQTQPRRLPGWPVVAFVDTHLLRPPISLRGIHHGEAAVE